MAVFAKFTDDEELGEDVGVALYGGEGTLAETAELLGDRQALDAEVATALPARTVELRVAIATHQVIVELSRREVRHGIEELLLLTRPSEIQMRLLVGPH